MLELSDRLPDSNWFMRLASVVLPLHYAGHILVISCYLIFDYVSVIILSHGDTFLDPIRLELHPIDARQCPLAEASTQINEPVIVEQRWQETIPVKLPLVFRLADEPVSVNRARKEPERQPEEKP